MINGEILIKDVLFGVANDLFEVVFALLLCRFVALSLCLDRRRRAYSGQAAAV